MSRHSTSHPIQTLLTIALLLILNLISQVAIADTLKVGIAQDLVNQVELTSAYKETSWVALMGGKDSNGVFAKDYIASEDGEEFYLAIDNDHNWLKNELLISIERLLDLNTKQRFICNYPARSFWIQIQFPKYFADLSFKHCTELIDWSEKFINLHFSLAFASSDYSQPASIFGHTFLALHPSETDYLDGYAINYAANFGDQSNSLSYFFKGLTGVYPGIITASPLYKKIKEYTVENQRDIYFYHLALTSEQKKQVIFTLWERKRAKFDYLFITENCSYAILKILQIIEPTIEIPKGLFGQVVPFETVKSAQEAALIDSLSVIYASSKKVEVNLQEFSSNDKEILASLVDHKISFEQWLSDDNRISNFIALQYLNLRIQQDDVDRLYARKLRNLFIRRILLETNFDNSNSLIQKPPKYADLFQTHLPNRSSIAVKHSNRSATVVDLNLRWAYHDLLDPVSPLLKSSSVEAFSGTLRVHDDDISLQRLDIISVKSLPHYSSLFPRKSKNLNVALTRSDMTNNKLGLDITWGRGLSSHTSAGNIFYGLMNFEFVYSPELSNSNAIGYSTELGFNGKLSKNTRLLINVNRKWYENENYTTTTFYTGVNFFFDKRTTITAEFFNDDNTISSETTAALRLNYFF